MARFIDALLAAGRPVIAEIKPHTGTGVDLVRGRSVRDLAAAYSAAGVACVSVVTGRWFGGTAALLDEVAASTGLPLLRKDFLTRRGQLVESRERGASAVLLTAGLLPAAALNNLIGAAIDLGLTPFVEVTTEAEVSTMDIRPEVIIAVNNKNIRVRETGRADLGRGRRLLPSLVAAGVRCPVSASGLDRPADAAAMLAAGYRGLLVGTGLLRAAGPTDWLAELDHCRAMPAATTGGTP